MYCSACGQAIDAYQPYCPRCGRQVTPISTATPPPWVWTRVHRHLHTLGILWVVYAGWMMLHWMLVMPFLAGMFHGWPMDHALRVYGPYLWFGRFPFGRMPWFLEMITALLAVRAIVSVIVGIALLRRASWGRVLAIIMAVLTLIHPLLGLILAIYTLWVLVPGGSRQEYDQMAVS
jgi:hypothetical protein